MLWLQVNSDIEPMAVLIHPTVGYRMNLTGILKGERWREQLSDPTSSQYYTLSQHFSEKVMQTYSLLILHFIYYHFTYAFINLYVVSPGFSCIGEVE